MPPRSSAQRKPAPAGCSPATWALFCDRLAESGLAAEDAAALGLRPVDSAQTLYAKFDARPAVVLTYRDPRTGGPLSPRPKHPAFYRIRYLGAEAPGFKALSDAKPRRYAQEAESGVCAYFPLHPAVDWRLTMADPARPLIMTEGELKAACACALKFPTIGLGGVYNWRSAKDGISFLPELEAVEWVRRRVYLVFDSDLRTNQMVCAALAQIAGALAERGALPFIAALPEVGEEGKKTGLDDFLVARGPEALEEVLEAAQPLTLAEALFALNDEVVYVRDPGLVVVRQTGQRLTPAAFTAHAYSARPFHEQVLDKEGQVKLKPAKAAQAWLAWSVRAEVGRLTYAPGEPKETEHLGAPAFNLWPGWGCEPRKGDVKPFLALVAHVFAGAEPEAVKWFLRWLACPLQRPGVKMHSSVVIWSPVEGVGKSMFGYTVKRIYGENFAEIGQQHLEGSFTEWAENKQFVMGEEITGSDKRAHAAALRQFITQESMRINVKMIPSYVVPDHINYLFTSNSPDAFFMNDLDRRYFVHEVTAQAFGDEFFTDYFRWLDEEGGASALFDWLMRHDLGDFNPKAPAFKTRARERMIHDSKSDIGAWVAALKVDPDGILRVGDCPVAGDLFTARELFELYDPVRRTNASANGLARELRKAGFPVVAEGAAMRGGDDRLDRFYAVRDRDRWAKATRRAAEAHLRERFGGGAEKKVRY